MFTTSNQQLPCDVLFSRLSSNRSRQLVGYGGRDCAVHVFPFAGYSAVARLEGLTAPVTSLAFTPDQTAVVAGSDLGGLQLWDLATEQSTRTFLKGHASTVTDVKMHGSGHIVATVSTDTNLRIWDTRKSSCVQSYKDARSPLCAVHFSPNGRWVATGCANGIVRIYNLRTAKLEAKLELHTSAITSLNFHPEMYFLAVGSGDSTISVWNLETFKSEFRSGNISTPIDCVQFCGNRLLSASDHQLRVYDARRLSDVTASVLDAPWTMIGDLAYVAFSDEAWFVECNASTATTGRLRLSEPSSAAAISSAPSTEKSNMSTPTLQQTPASPIQQQQQPPAPSRLPANAVEAQKRRALAPPRVAGARLEGVGRGRLAPAAPHSERSAALENYVVEKPAEAVNEAAPASSRPADVFVPPVGAAPQMPEVPFVDDGAAESDMVEQLISASSSFSAIIHRRLTSLRVMRSFWTQDQHAALEHLRRVCEDGADAGVVYDFLSAMQQQRMKEKMTVDALPDLLDVVRACLSSSHDPLVLVALRTLRSMHTKFRARVDEGQRRERMAQSNGHNDPLGLSSARGCVARFGACAMQVMPLTGRRDAIGEEARHLVSELPPPLRQ